MKFTSVLLWSPESKPKLITQKRLKNIFPDFFVESIFKLKVGESIDSDFRKITRVE